MLEYNKLRKYRNRTHCFWLGHIYHDTYNKHQGHHKVFPQGTHYTEVHSTCHISIKEALSFQNFITFSFYFSQTHHNKC